MFFQARVFFSLFSLSFLKKKKMSLVEEEDFLLYKWQAGWGLPSIDPASTQAEVCHV